MNGKDEISEDLGSAQWYRHPFVFAGFVLAAWVVTLAVALMWKDTEARGTFGDLFGAVNALFSGLAFVGLIYAILLQQKELQLQRQELTSTRAELKGQREANEQQNRFILNQTFENTLFQLLATLNDVIDAIDRQNVRTAAVTSKGRDAIASFFRTFRDGYHSDAVRLSKEDGKTSQEADQYSPDPISAYHVFYLTYGHELGHYFRLLYNVFKFIDSSEIDDKRRYSNIVRAQMSDMEVAMLFYNSLTSRGEGFIKYIRKYQLLKFMRPELLLRETHVSLHEQSAYGEGALLPGDGQRS